MLTEPEFGAVVLEVEPSPELGVAVSGVIVTPAPSLEGVLLGRLEPSPEVVESLLLPGSGALEVELEFSGVVALESGVVLVVPDVFSSTALILSI